MKTLLKSIKITLSFCVLCTLFYVLVLWLFAKVAGPNNGDAEVVMLNGKVVGAANVGQKFQKNIYFWGRPSCAGIGYDAMHSCGSNKAPSNKGYIVEVEGRIDTFLKYHPYLQRKDIPAEMVTASASGLDPDITLACACIQIRRVARARGMSETVVKTIVDRMTEHPLLGLFGTSKVNVLKLNVELDKVDERK